MQFGAFDLIRFRVILDFCDDTVYLFHLQVNDVVHNALRHGYMLGK